MRCPSCAADDSRVVDSRTVEDGVRRRRACAACAARFTTYERIERAPLLVVKRDGRREPFSREKLLAGLRRACEKRPLPAGAVEALAAAVEREMDACGAAELPSTAIGELVMARLKALDQIAYVRFASVYRDFADLDSLRAVVDELIAGRLPDAPAAPIDLSVAGIALGRSTASGPPRRRRRWAGRRPRDATRATPGAAV